MSAGERRSGRATVVLLAVGVGVAAVLVVLLGSRVLADRATDAAAREGTAAAVALTPQLLGYDFATIDADAARIDGAATGPFADQNRSIVASLVVPAARAERLTSTARVERAAVLAAAPGRVETLVVYTQTVARAGGPPGSEVRSARVVVVPSDGRWLVAGFDTL